MVGQPELEGDIGWWEAASSASERDPHVLAADISSARTRLAPRCSWWVMCQQAREVAAGWGLPWLAESDECHEAGVASLVRSWLCSKEFEKSHEGKPRDIDVMEYFTIISLVMLCCGPW